MAQTFRETAFWKTDTKKYADNYEGIDWSNTRDKTVVTEVATDETRGIVIKTPQNSTVPDIIELFMALPESDKKFIIQEINKVFDNYHKLEDK